MPTLIRGATLLSPGSPFHQRAVDLHWSDGRVMALAERLDPAAEADAELMAADGLFLAPAFTDIGTQVREPGGEQHEELESVAAAARAGGYGTLVPFPNTAPAVDGKTGVRYLKRAARELAVDLRPIGALSKGTRGEHPAELYDMYRAGAVAFSDGTAPLRDDGQLLRALQYTQAFDAPVIYLPLHRELQADGQMHEGVVSTSLGMRGIPAASERTAVQRAIELLRYGGGRLHLYAISSAAALPLIAAAKSEGLALTASVAALNLYYTDEALRGFDSSYKVLPPFRQETDRRALAAALADGTLDAVVSNHAPWDGEHKHLEFPYAEFGVPTLETAFAAARTATRATVSMARLVAAFTSGPQRLLGGKGSPVEVGYTGSLVLIDGEQPTLVQTDQLRSKGYGNPLVGDTLLGGIKHFFDGAR